MGAVRIRDQIDGVGGTRISKGWAVLTDFVHLNFIPNNSGRDPLLGTFGTN